VVVRDGSSGDGDSERRSGDDERPSRDDGPSAAHIPTDVTVGPAREGERATALSIVDMAGLQVDREAVMTGDSEVLVAVTDGRVLGALVLDGERIEAVAVRPGRQAQGIGSGLVAAASARRERLVAEFDRKVRDFYQSLDFDIEGLGESRYRGVLE
jgi:GNAT superfamily N-acetyltransferase